MKKLFSITIKNLLSLKLLIAMAIIASSTIVLPTKLLSMSEQAEANTQTTMVDVIKKAFESNSDIKIILNMFIQHVRLHNVDIVDRYFFSIMPQVLKLISQVNKLETLEWIENNINIINKSRPNNQIELNKIIVRNVLEAVETQRNNLIINAIEQLPMDDESNCKTILNMYRDHDRQHDRQYDNKLDRYLADKVLPNLLPFILQIGDEKTLTLLREIIRIATKNLPENYSETINAINNNIIERLHALENIIIENLPVIDKEALTEFNQFSNQCDNRNMGITKLEKNEVIESHINILNNIEPILTEAIELENFQDNSFDSCNIDFDLIMELNSCARYLSKQTQNTSEIAQIIQETTNRLLALTIEEELKLIISELFSLNKILSKKSAPLRSKQKRLAKQENCNQRKEQLTSRLLKIVELKEKLAEEDY